MNAPILAQSKVFADYLCAARTNLDNLLSLARDLRDAEFETEAQRILDCFDSAASDALVMIDQANGVFEEPISLAGVQSVWGLCHVA